MPIRAFDPHAGAQPAMTEIQRQLLFAGLGAIPVIGPFAAGAYGLGRLGTAIYRAFNPNRAGQMPVNSETNNPPMYMNGVTTPAPGTMPVNSETNNPPMYGNAPARAGQPPPATPGSSGYDMRGILNMWKNAFPGSALARFAPQAPYDPNQSRVPQGLLGQTGMTPTAAINFYNTRNRNIL